MKYNQMIQKRGYLLFLLCFTVIAGFAQRKLTILHTNDMHSRIEAISQQAADTAIAGKGGIIRVAECAEQLRKEIPDLLLFDSGDFSQGTPYYNLFKGEVEIKLMNAAGYDAATIGNHELDFGMENLARLIHMADFPFVCANYEVTGTVLEGVVKPYVILKRDGLSIGVFGLGTKLKGMVQDANCEGMNYLDPIPAANETATLLKKKGCDLIICLSHLGHSSDVKLIEQTRYIDVVLGGHSHTLMPQPETYNNLDGKAVYLNQMNKNAVNLGRLDLTIE